jgi:hypothetical protein
MFGWLAQSMHQDTVEWLVVSSVVGGVIGSAVRFGFEDVLRPRVSGAREIRAMTSKYSTPLIRSAESLERRINNFLRNLDQGWYGADDYYRMSTLYSFANYLAWIAIIEEIFGFLPYESSRAGRVFNRRINGFFRALSSFSYFSWCGDRAAVEASQVPRLALTAMGEVTENPDGVAPIRYSEFTTVYADDTAFRDTFGYLDKFLRSVEGGDPFARDRLVATGANLRGLIRFLDPHGRFVALRGASNLNLIQHPEVARQLSQEFLPLERTHSRPVRNAYRRFIAKITAGESA